MPDPPLLASEAGVSLGKRQAWSADTSSCAGASYPGTCVIRTVTWVAWIAAVLHVTGLLPEVWAGLEAHGFFVDNVIDQIKKSTFLGTDRIHSIRQAIHACRKGGRVSMPAVYCGFVDKFPLGAFMEKGLTLKTGQTHVQKYMQPLYPAIAEGKIDTTFLISHRGSLEDGPELYQKWHDEQDNYTKIVLQPGMERVAA